MRIAYFDCFAGASEGAILASLVDAGLGLGDLQERLNLANLDRYELRQFKKKRGWITCSQITVNLKGESPLEEIHSLGEIEKFIIETRLSNEEKKDIVSILRRLAGAEAKVRGMLPGEIDLQETGIPGSLIDIVGTVVGLSLLGVETIICSPLNTGYGYIEMNHSTIPAPPPATLELLRGKPCYHRGRVDEILTPVNAAILTTLACHFGTMPPMIIDRIGYGTGTTNSLLRVIIGRAEPSSHHLDTDQVTILETVIDDMSPQIYESVVDKLLAKGALDVYLTSTYMKKTRPAIALTVLCHPQKMDDLSRIILTSTTTIGLRWRIENRIKLFRSIIKEHTSYGPIRFKLASMGSQLVNVAPEYEDCKLRAEELRVPLKCVLQEAIAVAARIQREAGAGCHIDKPREDSGSSLF